jgi:hypothetical protein
MDRSAIETIYFGQRIQFYVVVDTMFNTIVIHTSSAKVAEYVSKRVNMCKHIVPYDYMLHDHTTEPKSD